MVEIVNRGERKREVRELLLEASVSPKRMTALYMLMGVLLTFGRNLGTQFNVIFLFLLILTWMMSLVLEAGFVLYCMTIRRREHAEYAVLFDGFGMVRKIIPLMVIKIIFITLWSFLFIIPGIVALYRYRFALYNLLEDPDLSVMEAIGMSTRQTRGYKWQLWMLDLSYIGWMILSLLPSLVYQNGLTMRVYDTYGMTATPWLYYDAMPGDLFGTPVMVWTVFLLVWPVVVAMFYLPNWQCVDLDYYDAARRSSGIGWTASSGYGASQSGYTGYGESQTGTTGYREPQTGHTGYGESQTGNTGSGESQARLPGYGESQDNAAGDRDGGGNREEYGEKPGKETREGDGPGPVV